MTTPPRPLPPADDDLLVARARSGDGPALEALLERYQDRIHAICRRVLANPEDALDATQEALIAVARGITRFDGRSQFSTWVYRVATNAALDEGRRRNRRPLPTEELPQPLERGPSVDGAVAERVDVDAALARLSPEFRAAVVLRDLIGCDYAEIAEILAIPAGTVRSRIARGRAALAEMLGNPGPGPGRQSHEAPAVTDTAPNAHS